MKILYLISKQPRIGYASTSHLKAKDCISICIHVAIKSGGKKPNFRCLAMKNLISKLVRADPGEQEAILSCISTPTSHGAQLSTDKFLLNRINYTILSSPRSLHYANTC